MSPRDCGVRFDAEHEFPAPAEEVAAVLTDQRFHRELALPDLSPPEVVQDHAEGAARVLVLRYEFVGTLDIRSPAGCWAEVD